MRHNQPGRKERTDLAAANNDILDTSNDCMLEVSALFVKDVALPTAQVSIFVHYALVARMHPWHTFSVDLDRLPCLLLILPIPGQAFDEHVHIEAKNVYPFCRRYPLMQSSPGVLIGTMSPFPSISFAFAEQSSAPAWIEQ
jgi:hypothetical protein